MGSLMADENINKFKIVERMLDANQPYDLIVATVAQLWDITTRQAEQQMTAAGYGRQKYSRKPTTKKPIERLREEDEQEKRPETKPEAKKEKKKRAAPKKPVKWTPQLEATVYAEWSSGVPVAEIAEEIGGTVDAVRARVRLIRTREAQKRESERQSQRAERARERRTRDRHAEDEHERKNAPHTRRDRLWDSLGSAGREAAGSLLGEFGLIGRAVERYLFGARGVDRERNQTGERVDERALERLTQATTRGAAELTRRVEIMGARVGDALDAATQAARSLVRRSGGGALGEEAAGTKRGPDGMGAGLFALLGAAFGGVSLLGSTRESEAALHPADKEREDKSDQESQLRRAAESEKPTSPDIELVSRDAEFKADKIVFDAQEIKGLAGEAAPMPTAKKGENGKGAQRQLPPPPAVASPPDLSSSGFTGGGNDRGGGGGGGWGGDDVAPAAQDKPEVVKSGNNIKGKIGEETLNDDNQKPFTMGDIKKLSNSPNAAGTEKLTNTGIDRARFTQELQQKPWLRDKIMRIAANEQSDNPHGVQAVLESMMNRAEVRGTSLEQQAKWHSSERGYYEEGTMGKGALENPRHRAVLENALDKVLNNSNISDYATDNSSGSLAARERATGSFVFRKGYGGESFFAPGTAEPVLAQRWKKWKDERVRIAQAASEAEQQKSTWNSTREADKSAFTPSPFPVVAPDSSFNTLDATPVPPRVPQPPSLAGLIDQQKSASQAQEQRVSMTTSDDAGDVGGQDRSSIFDVVEPTGPTFGGGKARVSGLDGDASSPWN